MAKVEEITDWSAICGTSFHGGIITSSMRKIANALGQPCPAYELGDKTHFELDVLIDGSPCCIYDWKEGDYITEDTTLNYHIGAKSATDSNKFVKVIKDLLSKK